VISESYPAIHPMLNFGLSDQGHQRHWCLYLYKIKFPVQKDTACTITFPLLVLGNAFFKFPLQLMPKFGPQGMNFTISGDLYLCDIESVYKNGDLYLH